MSDLISKLSELRSQYNCFDEHERDAYHTLSEAIKVLSERPEPCEDTVSRTDVFNAVRGEERGGYVDETVECMLKVMSDLPPVTPKRKTGKWIITSEFEDCYYAKCNQCNTTQVFYFNKSHTNFCPNCGCDMRG